MSRTCKSCLLVALLLCGCASQRRITLTCDAGNVVIDEKSGAAWIVGERATVITAAKTADGATTISIQDTTGKATMGMLGGAAIGAVAGLAAAP